MAIYSMWVSGNTVIAQDPNHFSHSWFDRSASNFTMLPGEHNSWFQFSIPTPTRVHDKVASLNRLMILFRADPPIVIPRVDLWDGPKLIGRFAYFGVMAGDQSQGISPNNTVDVAGELEQGAYQMNYGLNASIAVLPHAGGNITFVSVGADFQAAT